MFRNYLIVAFRNLYRNRLYSIVNILGFALGITVFLAIYLHVRYDLEFDKFHQNADRIWRLYTIDNAPGVTSSHVGITNLALASNLKANDPNVEEVTRCSPTGQNINLTAGERSTVSQQCWAVDGAFFKVFSWELIEGDRETVLEKPSSVLISPAIAAALFPGEDPIGKTFTFYGNQVKTVTGIIEPAPRTSHLQFDMLIRIQDLPGWEERTQIWQNLSLISYALLREGADPGQVEATMDSLAHKNGMPAVWDPEIQPLLDLHMRAMHMLYDLNYRKTDIRQVYSLSMIAVLVLVIAAFNFMNLSTARSAKRAREVGMRRISGATRQQMVFQFLGESILQTVLATILAVLLLQLIMPTLNQLSGRPLSFSLVQSVYTVPSLITLAVFVGLLSGIYPAVVLSSYSPVVVLKGDFRSSGRGILLRRTLVIAQFSASIALIVATLVAGQQIRFIRTMNPGYNRHEVLTMTTGARRFLSSREAFLNEVKKLTGVENISSSYSVPGRGYSRASLYPEGAQTEEEGMIMSYEIVDADFLKTLQIDLAAGRNFSPNLSSDSTEAILINEAAAHQLGYTPDEALGRKINLGELDEPQMLTIVGVMRDFHFASLRHRIEPIIFAFAAQPPAQSVIRVRPGMIAGTVTDIERLWKEFYPEEPFNYSFLDDEFDQMYMTDIHFSQIVQWFSALAVFIACLGLFGLASFATEQRRHEIAVRKVLGAGERRIVGLLTGEFLRWVLIANLIAWPLGYFGIKRWLADFEYHTHLTVWPFLIASVTALVIAVITVSLQTIRAAQANPADVLRQE
ncbi:MAG: ABC transporter permease [bacterium]